MKAIFSSLLVYKETKYLQIVNHIAKYLGSFIVMFLEDTLNTFSVALIGADRNTVYAPLEKTSGS